MRYGPNRLIFNSATALRDIYQNPRTTKSHLYLFSTNNGVPFIFNTLDRSGHARKRKIIGPALSDRSMRMFEPVLSSQIDVFLKHLLTSGSKPVDVSERFRRLAMDIVVHLAYGYPLDLQIHDEHYFILQSISLANWKINSFMNWPFLSKIGIQLLLNRSPVRHQWRNIVEKMIRTRVEQDSPERRDFYSFVLQNLDAESAADFRQSELFSESLFFISAGGDTVSTAMAGVFFYLARNNRCYDKLADEIRSKFKAGSEIQGGPQLSSCRYLRACIDETLRMSPPVGGTLWRETAEPDSKEPFVVDGHIIPPGTHVGVNTYSIHHNEEYFPDPFTFSPERWLQSGEKPDDSEGMSTKHRAFVPFSVGMRSCLGKSMAYLETSLLLAKTLWYFDFERCEGSLGDVGGGKEGAPGGRGRVDEFQLYDVITSRHDGPWLSFTPRKDYVEDLL
ncbi:cytochrome P450 [Pestalotiopsis sp. NC0098]|nr:cytochrome P450 [Pestalotiopsis sp. NC0098]